MILYATNIEIIKEHIYIYIYIYVCIAVRVKFYQFEAKSSLQEATQARPRTKLPSISFD